jgi:DNA-binding response OmpR family regulator
MSLLIMPKKILIVDDEKDIVDLISYNLEKEGFAVLKAYDGESALKLVDTKKPDLVILDLMLPGMRGLEVCKFIRKNPAIETLPIIMLTAKGDQVDKILGLEMGADDYVTKPFNVRELIARIHAVLRRAEGRSDSDKKEHFAYKGYRGWRKGRARPDRIETAALPHPASRQGLHQGSAS